MSRIGGVPDTVACYLFRSAPVIQREWVTFPLALDGKFSWLEHPNTSAGIDIGILPLTIPEQNKAVFLNELPLTQIALRVSLDVFVLGYPLGLTSIHGLPIWKRASVASEPGGSSPFFYIDTATRPGMSGSPVIVRYRGFYKEDLEAPTIADTDWFGEGDDFVGVYSGRIGIGARLQLGKVWKRNLIDEIIHARKPYAERA